MTSENKKSSIAALTLSAVGIVYGDIGTSPLYTLRAIFDPEHGLPATGRSYRVPGVSVGRVRDGRIVENRDYWNLADYLQQVGLMPSPDEAVTTGG